MFSFYTSLPRSSSMARRAAPCGTSDTMPISMKLSIQGILYRHGNRRPFSICFAVAGAFNFEEDDTSKTASRPVRIVAVVGRDAVSPLKGAPWEQVMLHTAERLKWVDESYEMEVYTDDRVNDLRKTSANADILLSIAVSDQEASDCIRENSKNIPNFLSLEKGSSYFGNKLGGSTILRDQNQKMIGMPTRDESKKVSKMISDAWARYSADDIRFCILVIINAYVRPVHTLKNLRAKGFSTLTCMAKNCGYEVLACLLDPKCREALECLDRCSPTDQVCSYRCIASYESPNFEAFCQCVLQEHNCLGLDAEIPEHPYMPPMETFRGEPLSHEIAEDLLVGWLGALRWSWRVVAGQNSAYDQFPSQYQLCYREKEKGLFCYEPVFQVKTPEGKMVWKRKKHTVRRAEKPGTFYFKGPHNGVNAVESWTVVDVSDDLSWGLFHYRGAAAVAGQSYAGAVLVSPDGKYSSGMGGTRLAAALEKCRIKTWELYEVSNGDDACDGPPLDIPEGSSFHRRIQIRGDSRSSFTSRV
ncbi:uncharacterized protein LOC144703818 [Wolffia australiana]